MGRIRSLYLAAVWQCTGYGIVRRHSGDDNVAAAVAQPPVNSPASTERRLPPDLSADFGRTGGQPLNVGQPENLEAAWAVALSVDQRIAASEWSVSAARSGWNAAPGERCHR